MPDFTIRFLENMYLTLFFASTMIIKIAKLDGQFSSTGDGSHDTLVLQGKMQYEIIQLDSRMPRYGECWKGALHRLDRGCKRLDDDVQSRLALSFANCFLEKAGLRTYPCADTTPISVCLQNVETNAFTTYSNFFSHTQNMCYFLQSQVWHEETELTVNRLASTSAKVSRSIEDSHKLQLDILDGQQRSLEFNKQLVANSSFLTRAIEVSKESVRDMITEFRLSTSEQKTLIFEVFDRVARLQNLVVSEVNWLYTVVFYGACLLVIYIVTATKRTADARLWLFVLLTVNLGLERAVCWWSLPADGAKVATGLSEVIYDRVWMTRQFTIGLSIFILTTFALKFKDYNLINNTLLQEIKKQNLELKRSMETFQVRTREKFRYSGDTVDAGAILWPPSIQSLLAEDTGFQGDEEEEDDDDDVSDNSESFNSTRTDLTFVPPNEATNLSDEFCTAQNSREHSRSLTPVNQRLEDLLEPVLSATAYPPVVDCSAQPLLFTPRSKREGDSRTPRSSTPTPTRDAYNLRSRRSACRGSAENPLLGSESPETFAQLVQRQLGTTRRNYAKWQMALKKETGGGGEFSSDEL